MEATDLAGKYQKLAAEYQKLRAQVPVLKKAVIDEQAAIQELKVSLNERDKSIRKYDQEIESLNFRNSQLATRVEYLQKELDANNSKGKKTKNKAAAEPAPRIAGGGVLHEELQHRIVENTRLQEQIEEMTYRVSVLETVSAGHDATLQAARQEGQQLVDGLTYQLALLQSQVAEAESKQRACEQRAEEAEAGRRTATEECAQLHASTNEDPQLTLATAARRPMSPCPHDARHSVCVGRWRDLAQQATPHVLQWMQAMPQLYAHLGQRCLDLGLTSQLTPGHCDTMSRQDTYMQPLCQAYQAYCASLQGEGVCEADTQGELSRCFSAYATYISSQLRISDDWKSRIEEEGERAGWTSSVSKRKLAVHSALHTYSARLSHLDTAVTDVCTRGGTSNVLLAFSRALSNYHTAIKGLEDAWSQLNSLLYPPPSPSATSDANILSALNKLTSCTSQLSVLVSGGVSQLAASPPRPSTPTPHSAPSATENAECDSLREQVSMFQERLAGLEEEREHWRLESQLILLKYERLQEEITCNENVAAGDDAAVVCNDANNVENYAAGAYDDVAGGAREQLIRTHLTARLRELTLSLQTADSKAVNFHAECRALHKRLHIAQKQKENLAGELATATQSITSLKDELATTARGYEAQSSLMSEHLAAMNEKLAGQADEIEALGYQLRTHKEGGARRANRK